MEGTENRAGMLSRLMIPYSKENNANFLHINHFMYFQMTLMFIYKGEDQHLHGISSLLS